MIQLKKYLFVATFLLTLATTASAKLVQTKVYLFGMAASFNDSTAYMTDVQEIDAWINDKGKFLYSRENYSYQLRDFLQSQGFANATCITCFALSRPKAMPTCAISKATSLNSNLLPPKNDAFEAIIP